MGTKEEVETGRACLNRNARNVYSSKPLPPEPVPPFNVGVWVPLNDTVQATRGEEREGQREREFRKTSRARHESTTFCSSS